MVNKKSVKFFVYSSGMDEELSKHIFALIQSGYTVELKPAEMEKTASPKKPVLVKKLKKKPRRFSSPSGKSLKEQVEDILAQGPMHIHEISKHFTQLGYGKNSAYATVSFMKSTGKANKDENGLVTLVA